MMKLLVKLRVYCLPLLTCCIGAVDLPVAKIKDLGVCVCVCVCVRVLKIEMTAFEN